MCDLANLYKNSDSLKIIELVNKQLKNFNKTSRIFHNFTSILYDIRTILGDGEKTYLEIGTMSGSSAGLILQHEYKTNVFCVDPCIDTIPDMYNTIKNNLEHLNVNNNNITIFKNYSQDISLLQKLKEQEIKIDILFIDGDHKYDAVVRDFNNYKEFVNSNGYIIFDDYHDAQFSPEVKPAVDFLVKNLDSTEFEIVGALENHHNIYDKKKFPYINEFILYKK
jgi:predicted O-methyltransferase YrrM